MFRLKADHSRQYTVLGRLGATVQIESQPGQGTRVTLTLPPDPVTASNVGLVGLDLSDSVLTSP